MKKVICLLFSVIMIASCCACQRMDKLDPDEYISEAALTQCTTLLVANQRLYNEVFVLSHLTTDDDNTFEKDGVTYAPVNDSRYSSYSDLVNEIKSIYTEELAEDILDKYNYYKEIDGVFCFDTSCEEKIKEGRKWEYSNKNEIELEGKDGDSYTLEFYFVCGKRDCRQEFDFIKTDSGYKLTEFKSAR